jgi:hypothetical protein
MMKNATERINNIAGMKISRRNLVQRRCEQNEIFTTNQDHFYVGTASEPFVKIPCCAQSGESATSNYDLGLFHFFEGQ